LQTESLACKLTQIAPTFICILEVSNSYSSGFEHTWLTKEQVVPPVHAIPYPSYTDNVVMGLSNITTADQEVMVNEIPKLN